MNNIDNPLSGRAVTNALRGQWPLIIILALLAGATAFLVYLPSLGNGFVTWDDTTYVVGNEHIRSMGGNFLRWAFTSAVSSNYHPLTMISLALEYSAFGLNPMGYHLGNAAWHAVDTALLFILVIRLHGPLSGAISKKKALTAALVTALLFAVHPLHVESVAWVSERKDVLSTFFFILSILFYLGYTKKARAPLYGLTLLSFCLALLSKPMAVTLPVVMLIVDYYPLKRDSKGWGRLVIEKIPFFALSLIFALITLMAQKKGGSIQSLGAYSNMDRIVIPIRAYAFYLYKLIVPVRLSPIYPLPLERGFFTPATLLSLSALIIISVFVIILARHGRRIFIAVWAFYIITLLPVIGIIKVGGQAAADRYAYIPTMGFLILAGLFIASFWDKRRSPFSRYIIFSLTAAVLIAFSVLTVRQTGVWKDSLTFWSHIIKSYPEEVPIAYHKRGVAYAKAGAYRLAEADFTDAIRLQEGKAFPYYNRAKVRASQGKLDKAIEDFTALLDIDSGYTRVYYERGLLYERTGQYELAVKDMQKALSLQPDLGEAYSILVRLYGRLGKKELQEKNRKKAERFFFSR